MDIYHYQKMYLDFTPNINRNNFMPIYKVDLINKKEIATREIGYDIDSIGKIYEKFLKILQADLYQNCYKNELDYFEMSVDKGNHSYDYFWLFAGRPLKNGMIEITEPRINIIFENGDIIENTVYIKYKISRKDIKMLMTDMEIML